MTITIKKRNPTFNTESLNELHPLLARIFANRGISRTDELEYGLERLLPYQELKGIQVAASALADRFTSKAHLLVVGDFDADGATSTALAVSTLLALGAAQVTFLVPNRFEYGYGLTPEIVEVAAVKQPDCLITVDNGISSIEGVAAANALGIDVIITDHHLPAQQTPEALAIVNPNQHGCQFASKNLAGVGVIFYVMLALRAELRERGWFEQQNITEPNLAKALDLVALGTVADVVPLDHNNRILVQQGLARIKAGHCRPGIQAILELGRKPLARLHSKDLGFVAGPRINAAGRLDDMSLGIECLLAEDLLTAQEKAQQLDQLNQERKEIEQDMREQAIQSLQKFKLDRKSELPLGLCLYDESWHQGVIGIVASRIKERCHRPVIAFAKANETEVKGSGRSIEGLHLRDLLDKVATENPGLIQKFGGHAMAAGLSLKEHDIPRFAEAFQEILARDIDSNCLENTILTDGELAPNDFDLKLARLLQDAGPWGQHFPEPLFDGTFNLVQQRLLGGKHLKMTLAVPETKQLIDAIAFNIDADQWPNHRVERVRLVYRLDVNEYKGMTNLQLLVEHINIA